MSEQCIPETQAQKTRRHLRRLDELLDQKPDTSCQMRHEDFERCSEGLPIIPARSLHFEYETQCRKQHGACPHVWGKIRAEADNVKDILAQKTWKKICRVSDILSEHDDEMRRARTGSIDPVRIEKRYSVPNPNEAQRNAQPILDQWESDVDRIVEPIRLEALAEVRRMLVTLESSDENSS